MDLFSTKAGKEKTWDEAMVDERNALQTLGYDKSSWDNVTFNVYDKKW